MSRDGYIFSTLSSSCTLLLSISECNATRLVTETYKPDFFVHYDYFFHPRATRIKYIFMTFFGRDMHSTSIHSDVALFPPPSNVVFNHGFSSMEYSVHGEKIDFWALTRDLIASTLPICRCTAHFWQNQVHQNPLDSENRYIWKCRILNFINQKLNILTETVLIAAFKWTNRFIAFVCTLSPPNSLFMRCFFSPSILIVDH